MKKGGNREKKSAKYSEEELQKQKHLQRGGTKDSDRGGAEDIKGGAGDELERGHRPEEAENKIKSKKETVRKNGELKA